METNDTAPISTSVGIKNHFIKEFSRLIERRDKLFSLFRKKLEEEKIQELRDELSLKDK